MLQYCSISINNIKLISNEIDDSLLLLNECLLKKSKKTKIILQNIEKRIEELTIFCNSSYHGKIRYI